MASGCCFNVPCHAGPPQAGKTQKACSSSPQSTPTNAAQSSSWFIADTPGVKRKKNVDTLALALRIPYSETLVVVI